MEFHMQLMILPHCVSVFFYAFMFLWSYVLESRSQDRRASWYFSPFLCICFVATLCFSVFMVSWFGASVVSYLHGSYDSSESLSSQPVSLFLYLFCIFLGVRSFSRRWFHIRPNNQLLNPKFASWSDSPLSPFPPDKGSGFEGGLGLGFFFWNTVFLVAEWNVMEWSEAD